MPPLIAIWSSVAAPIVSPMPTTNVLKPMLNASVTACCAPAESAMFIMLAGRSGLQVGSPSVASNRYFGFGSVSVAMYAAAAFIPFRVGVGLPVVVRPIAATIAAPFIGPIGTSGAAVTAHELVLPK